MASYTTPPCPMCGVWECLDCGVKASRRNRYYPGKHRCRTCRSTNGRMLPTHHRDDIHELHAGDVVPQDICHYPLDGSEPTTQQIPGQTACPSGRNPMTTETIETETETPTEPESPDITVWTTENAEAVVWGTHDLPAAKKAYEAMRMDTEPDWDDVRLMWGAPHLLDLEVWDASDYGDEPKDGRVPYMVFGF